MWASKKADLSFWVGDSERERQMGREAPLGVHSKFLGKTGFFGAICFLFKESWNPKRWSSSKAVKGCFTWALRTVLKAKGSFKNSKLCKIWVYYLKSTTGFGSKKIYFFPGNFSEWQKTSKVWHTVKDPKVFTRQVCCRCLDWNGIVLWCQCRMLGGQWPRFPKIHS